MTPESLYLLFNKILNQEATPQENEQLQQWLLQQPENQKLWQQVQAIWQATGNLSISLLIDHDQAWGSIQQKIQGQPKIIPLWYRPQVRMAAAVVLIALMAIGYFLSTDTPTSYQTLAAETMEIGLPDGSMVWLNQSSLLSYTKDYNQQERTVELSGEAFFQVKKDPQRTFTVRGANLSTKVLGTSFNVRMRPQDELSEVTVATGKVLVEAGTESITLVAGDRALWDRNSRGLEKITHQDSNYLAWRDKKLVFENAKFNQVIADLEEYFGVVITLSNQDIAQCQVTSSFDEPTLEEVLEVLSLTLNLNYSQTGDGYAISGEGCFN